MCPPGLEGRLCRQGAPDPPQGLRQGATDPPQGLRDGFQADQGDPLVGRRGRVAGLQEPPQSLGGEVIQLDGYTAHSLRSSKSKRYRSVVHYINTEYEQKTSGVLVLKLKQLSPYLFYYVYIKIRH